MAVCKLMQRRVYDILSHRVALILFVSLAVTTVLLVFLEIGEVWFFWNRHSRSKLFFYEANTGGNDARICGPVLPIDIVYTWTNFSDPSLQAKWSKLMSLSGRNDLSTTCPEENCMTSHIVAYRACNVASNNIRTHEPLLPVDALHGGTCNNQTLVLVELDSMSKAIGVSKLGLAFEGHNLTTAVRQTFWTTNLNDPRHILTPNRVRLCGLPPDILALKNSKLLKYLHKILRVKVMDVKPYLQRQCAIVRLSSVKSVDHVIVSKDLMLAEIYAQRVALGLYTIDGMDNRLPQDFNIEGLRYSLRSLEKYAPWIRHVYLVTDGQIPNWLNLNNERITLVKHSDIFADAKYLPTFNGAAVDSNIHRISGLSTHFLYLTGNIIFGNDVWPEDFFTNSHGYKLYKAWRTPECSPACRWPWIGDGSCDEECDEPECGFDGGDCEIVDEPENAATSPHRQSSGQSLDVKERIKKLDTKITSSEASITGAVIRTWAGVKVEHGTVILGENNGLTPTDTETVQVITQFPNSQRAKYQSVHFGAMHSLPNAGALWVEPGKAEDDDQKPNMAAVRFMNLLLNKELGFASQWIPSPTPILFNKRIVATMIARFNDHWRATSERRWESTLNLHFIFMYFAFLMGEYAEISESQLFDEFDTDKSGSWSDREMRILMARSQRGPLTEDIITWFERTLLSCVQTGSSETPKLSRTGSSVMPERYEDSPLPLITKSLVLGCEPFRDQVLSQLTRRRRYEHEVLDHWGRETAFVVTGKMPVLVGHLDDIRLYPRKFIHIQRRAWADTDVENAKEKSSEEDVLLDMMYSLLPYPSSFELPAGVYNELFTIDEVESQRKEKWRMNLIWGIMIAAVIIVPFTACWRSVVVSVCGRFLLLFCCRYRYFGRTRRRNKFCNYSEVTVI